MMSSGPRFPREKSQRGWRPEGVNALREMFLSVKRAPQILALIKGG